MKLGGYGEDLAVNALIAEGYRIVERNARIYKREVDIIATDGQTLVFIEVKARKDHSYGKPLEAVTPKRRARIRKAAELYVMKNRMKNAPVRFDVVCVDFAGGDAPEVEVVKNAF